MIIQNLLRNLLACPSWGTRFPSCRCQCRHHPHHHHHHHCILPPSSPSSYAIVLDVRMLSFLFKRLNFSMVLTTERHPPILYLDPDLHCVLRENQYRVHRLMLMIMLIIVMTIIIIIIIMKIIRCRERRGGGGRRLGGAVGGGG